MLIFSHQVAGAKPGISGLENIAENFFFGSVLVGVALESASEIRRVFENFADCLAGLFGAAANAESLFIANWFVVFDVEFDQRRAEAMRQIRRNPADGSRLAFDVEQRDVALGRGIKLEDIAGCWNRLLKSSQMSARSPLPQASRMR